MSAFRTKVDASSDDFKRNAAANKALAMDLRRVHEEIEHGGSEEARTRHTGRGKLLNIERTAGFFESIDIPLPLVNAYAAGITECVGGLLLLIGLGSRLAAIPLVVTMLVAYATAHREEGGRRGADFLGAMRLEGGHVGAAPKGLGGVRQALDGPHLVADEQ